LSLEAKRRVPCVLNTVHARSNSRIWEMEQSTI
jgi:hypothetical protein